MAKLPENPLEETLDPQDWAAAQSVAHAIVDDAVKHIANLRERPVWQEMPQAVRDYFGGPLPTDPLPLATVYGELRYNLMPYAMGNIHPRFWAWYMGSSNFTGALADFLAAIDGSNLGGGNTAAAALDRQVVNWMKSIMGFPSSASGTLTSGGSMANMVALTVARNVKAGVDVRVEGISSLPKPLRFYASDQSHSCHQKALETLGLGSRSLALIASKADFSMNTELLKKTIERDIAAGCRPACVIATIGTTNSGAIDDIEAISDICRSFDLWLHVDGCIGALIKLAPKHRHLVTGIENADSLALDPHKWMHTPFEAGCVLIKDAKAHFAAFNLHGAYLEEKPRGIAAGEFLSDYGFELSRSLKALKIWMSLKEHGVNKFGRLIDQNIEQAAYLTSLLKAHKCFELMAPTKTSIVCYRYAVAGASEAQLKALNTEIMLQLQETGIAAPSDTTLRDKHCLRVAINNHRTRREDLELLVRESIRIGQKLEAVIL